MYRKSHPKIIILGAGLAGISTAYFLRNAGINFFRVYEKEHTIGGLCRSNNLKGYTFDCCGHILHFRNKSISTFIKNLLGDNLIQHKRRAGIYSFGRLTRYPFQINLYGLPSSIIKECLEDFIKVRIDGIRRTPKNFQEWCYQNFGKSITKYFMEPYNKKFWNLPLRDLSFRWVDGFVIVPTIKQVIEGTIEESRRNVGYHSFFFYPQKGGIEFLIHSLAKPIEENIFMGREAERIDIERRNIWFKNRFKEKYDILISTLPLPELGRIIPGLPEEILKKLRKLRWVSIFNLNLGLKEDINYPWHWIYCPERKIKFFRVGFFHNFSEFNAPPQRSSIYVEVAYSQDKQLDKKKIVPRIMNDLKKIGLLKGKNQIEVEVINDIKYAYPIYDFNYDSCREGILQYLKEHNIYSTGRFGGWQYLSMEDVIKKSKELVDFLNKRIL